MDDVMKQVRRELLQCHLEVASLRNGLSPRDRVGWVAGRLEHEVTSWYQFVALLPARSMTPLAELPAFGMISLCLELLEQELDTVTTPDAVTLALGTFRESLLGLQAVESSGWLNARFSLFSRRHRERADLDRRRADQLVATARRVSAALASTPGGEG